MQPIYVCQLQDLAGGHLVREVPEVGAKVLLALVDGELQACVARCPHGDVELGDLPLQGPIVTCRGHRYQFHLVTGQCTHTRHLQLTKLPVFAEDDAVFLGNRP